MKYSIKYIRVPLFLSVLFGGIIVSLVACSYIMEAEEYNKDIVPLITIGIMAAIGGSFLVAQAIAMKKHEIEITDTLLNMDGASYPFSEIKSYYVRAIAKNVYGLDIMMNTGKEITIGGRLSGPLGDEPFGSFYKEMKKKLSHIPDLKYAESLAAKRLKKLWNFDKKFIKILVALVLIVDAFAVYAWLTGGGPKFLLILLANIILPNMLMQIKRADQAASESEQGPPI